MTHFIGLTYLQVPFRQNLVAEGGIRDQGLAAVQVIEGPEG
jgi:hypothetical protein